MARVMVGVIGGSGVETALAALGGGRKATISTPFGSPSGPISVTEVGGVPVALLARHGEGHRLNPSRVPYRANIFALKTLGVTHVLASGAVGSLREDIAPRSLVIPDQVIDKTFRRDGTFFDELAVHVELASPFCASLRGVLAVAGSSLVHRIHHGGTYVCMEGPQFSTKAESALHRTWGASVIGMTAMPEARLAREAELCYGLVALPTDYDCWRPHATPLESRELLKELLGNLEVATQNALDLLRVTIPAVAALGDRPCPCQSALSLGIWTNRSRISPETREQLRPILGKYLD